MIDYNKKMKRLEKCGDSEVYSAFDSMNGGKPNGER